MPIIVTVRLYTQAPDLRLGIISPNLCNLDRNREVDETYRRGNSMMVTVDSEARSLGSKPGSTIY